MAFSMQGMNELLFAQMERLHGADAESVADEVERSKAMAKTAETIVGNARAMMDAARMQAQAQEMLASRVTMESSVPALLLGQRPVEAEHALPDPDVEDWDQIDAFLEANAASHSLSWLVDRIGGALGVRVGRDELRERCAALGVAPVELGGHGDPFASAGEAG